jgi:hypothetical protein
VRSAISGQGRLPSSPLERGVGQAGALVAEWAVLAMGGLSAACNSAAPMAPGPVGQSRFESVAVGVCERHSRAGVSVCAPADHAQTAHTHTVADPGEVPVLALGPAGV